MPAAFYNRCYMKQILNFIVQFFKSRRIGYYFTLPAFVFAILGLIFYRKGYNLQFGVISEEAVKVYIAGIIVCAVAFLADFKEIKFISLCLLVYAFLVSLTSQANYITNVLVSIDGNSFTANFLCGAVFGLLGWLFELLALIFTRGTIFNVGLPKKAK